MKKRTEIIIETYRRIQVRRDGPATGWCPDCAQQVGLLGPEQLAQLLDVSLREVCRRLEAGKFHVQGPPGGRLLICVKSVQQTKADKEK
jgi:hypothetical protein